MLGKAKDWLKKFSLPRPTGQTLRTIALFMGAPIFGGIMIWQLLDLSPATIGGICKTFKFSEDTCFQLHTQVYGIKDSTITGLLVLLGIGYIMMMMREMRMQGEFKGPLGMGGSFRSDDGSPAPKITTETKTTIQPGAPAPQPPPDDLERG